MQLRRLSPTTLAGFVVLVVLAALAAACGAGASPILSGVGGQVGAPAPTRQPASRPGDEDDQPRGDGQTVAIRDDARIVRTGSLQLQVADLDAAVEQATSIVDSLGGYIGESRISNSGRDRVAAITYRIPSDRWSEALARLRDIAVEVLDEQTEAIEVTGQLVDLEARIANLRAAEQALQAIAEEATRIQDVLEVQQRLTEVRGQIEQLSAQQAQLTDRVAYGTVRVTFGLEVVAVTEAAERWDPADEVDRATASLVDILQAIATAGIWIGIVWLPVLVGLGVGALVVALVLRRLGVLRRRWFEPTSPEPHAPTN